MHNLSGDGEITADDCRKCHEAVHGPKATQFLDCMSCHKEPIQEIHWGNRTAPEGAPEVQLESRTCDQCHGNRVHSVHLTASSTEEDCSYCHTESHGGPVSADCSECHQYLQVDPVKYPANTSNDLCSQCHASPAELIKADGGRHSTLNCTKCHDVHMKKPFCTKCHDRPHGKEVSDCTKCHSAGHDPDTILVEEQGSCMNCHGGGEPVQLISESGGKHSTLSCTSCHQPDKQHGSIPDCSSCHGAFHGQGFSNCSDCHSGHDPLPATVPSKSCSLCHGEQSTTLRDSPSTHSGFRCTFCHDRAGTHNQKVPDCSQCHDRPHGKEVSDCTNCHSSGHKPLAIELSSGAASSDCGACHSETFNGWQATKTKHGTLGCVSCHEEHGEKPACVSCHGNMHGIEEGRCTECHKDAHKLRYPATG